jgi:hypothetical protein
MDSEIIGASGSRPLRNLSRVTVAASPIVGRRVPVRQPVVSARWPMYVLFRQQFGYLRRGDAQASDTLVRTMFVCTVPRFTSRPADTAQLSA